MDSCQLQRAQPVPDALDYADALGSVEGMVNFARQLRGARARSLRDLAMGRQVAECLGSGELADWCRERAETEYHVASMDDLDYARYQLARMDIAELIPLMAMRGHM